MNTFLRSLIYVIPVVWAGCTFQADESIFYKEVEKTLPEARINLNNFNNSDTIFIFSSATFEFNVSADRGQFLQARVLLNSREILSQHTSSGKFAILENMVTTGAHVLRIELTNTAGTGSLVDKLGGEVVQAWRQWVVMADFTPPTPPTITFSEENGYLKLSWPKYTKPDFANYQLAILGPGYRNEVILSNSNENCWIDKQYAGGYANYTLKLGSMKYMTSTTSREIYDPQQLEVSYQHEDSTAVLKWRRNKYYSVAQTFKVYENDILRRTMNNPTDTTLNLKMQEVILGQHSSISLKISRSTDNYIIYDTKVDITNPLQTNKMVPYPNLYLNETQSLVGYYQGQLCNYNSAMEKGNCRTVPTSVIPYKGDYGYYYSKPYAVNYNLTSGTKKEKLMSNANITIFGNISGGGNQIMAYAYIENVPGDNRFHKVIMDMANDQIIHESNTPYISPNHNFTYSLSDDGTHVYDHSTSGGSFYKINNGSLEFLFTNNHTLGSYSGFRPEDGSQAFFHNAITGQFNIVNLDDQSIAKTITLPEPMFMYRTYDPTTKTALFIKYLENRIRIVNLETNEQKTIGALYSTYKLFNGYLFTENGNYLKLIQ